MKFVKKLTALFLAVVMVMAMGITAFADEVNTPAESTKYTLTINESVEGYAYEAYQIFSGTLKEENDTKTLGDIKWGKGVDTAKEVNGKTLLQAIQAISYGEGAAATTPFANCTTAAQVAEVVATFNKDTNKVADSRLTKFADVVSQYLSTTAQGSANSLTNGKYVINNLEAGYYLVKNTAVPTAAAGQAPYSYSRFMLEVVSTTEITPKTDKPSVDKTIVETAADSTTSETDYNTATIGSKVDYKVTSNVPDMTGYNKYYFILNDTMSKGLTFNDDIEVKILTKDAEGNVTNTTTLTKDTSSDHSGTTGYYVESSKDTDGVTSIKIVLENFIQYANRTGDEIVVTYSATLNENAVLTDAGNPNSVKLTYSNNPTVTPEGKDEPGDNDHVTGETPESTTKTYATGIKLTKYEKAEKGQNPSKTLTGAVFTITGTSKKTVITNSEMFIQNDNAAADNTYYLLLDGTYTKVEKTTATADKYYLVGGQAKKYEKVTTVTKDTTDVAVNTFGTVNASGVLTIEGLGEGTYTITEIKAPDGYNLLDAPIVIKITANETEDNAGWTVIKINGQDDTTLTETDKANDPTDETLTAESNLYKLDVENAKGSVLPSTGGMGTTVIYAAGIALIVAAGVVVIVKKRFA